MTGSRYVHVGAAAPGADLLHRQQPLAGLLDPAAQRLVRRVRVVEVGDGVRGQVGVEVDLGHRRGGFEARCARDLNPRVSSASRGSSKPMVIWWRARSPSAVARRPSAVSVDPSFARCSAPRLHGLGQGEGVGDLQVGLEVHGPVEGRLLGVEGDVPLVRRVLPAPSDLRRA